MICCSNLHPACRDLPSPCLVSCHYLGGIYQDIALLTRDAKHFMHEISSFFNAMVFQKW